MRSKSLKSIILRNTEVSEGAGSTHWRRPWGPVDADRFLESFDLGKGDYTQERIHVLNLELDEIVKGIEKRLKPEPG